MNKSVLGTLIKKPKKTGKGRPYVVGVTGRAGSGKSCLSIHIAKSEQFVAKNRSVKIIEYDKIGHESYADPNGETFKNLVNAFGKEIITDNKINRTRLAEIVFDDKEKMIELRKIVWPSMRELLENKINECDASTIIVIDAAILIEAGIDEQVNEVWVTAIKKKDAVNRLTDSRKWSEEKAWAIVNTQLSDDQYVQKAHVLFSTIGHVQETKAQVENAVSFLLQRI